MVAEQILHLTFRLAQLSLTWLSIEDSSSSQPHLWGHGSVTIGHSSFICLTKSKYLNFFTSFLTHFLLWGHLKLRSCIMFVMILLIGLKPSVLLQLGQDPY